MGSSFPPPTLAFGGVLLVLLALMTVGGRLVRSGGRPVSSGRALALGLVYATMYLLFALPAWATAVGFAAIGLAATGEIGRAFAAGGLAPFDRPTRIAAAAFALVLPWLALATTAAPAIGAVLAAMIDAGIAACGLLAFRRPGCALLFTAATAAAALDAFTWLRIRPDGAALCLFAFFLLNAADTAAYFAGKQFGRHALAPRISPGKTIEGAAGGLAATLCLALLFARVLQLPFTVGQTLFAAVLLNVLGLAGDLLASRLKRRVGLKDFSTLLAGHGGVLDRFDSCLLAAPGFLLWVSLVQ